MEVVEAPAVLVVVVLVDVVVDVVLVVVVVEILREEEESPRGVTAKDKPSIKSGFVPKELLR